MKIGLSIAATALLLAPTIQAQDTRQPLQMTNTGELLAPVFSGHDLTPPSADGGGPRILYAPSEADDAGYRAAIATAAGPGAVVDYFDARAATPSVAELGTYDCCYTWANFAYSNNVLFGDNLATANDAGLDVVLGTFCTFTTGNFLSGQIMTAAYNPVVSPTGTNHFSTSSYVGDGASCMYGGVSTLSCNFRDFLVTQGNGVADGSFADGEICGAIRPDPGGGAGDVVYNNGSGASALGCPGDWAPFAAASCTCDPGSGSFGSCVFFNGGGTNPAGFNCTNVPFAGQTWNSTVEGAPGFTATIVVIGSGGPSSGSFFLGGEILVAGPTFIFDVAPSFAHAIPIPLGLGGVAVSTQGVVLTPGSVILRNGQATTIGG